MVKVSETYSSNGGRFLRASDLPPGARRTAVIHSAANELVGQKERTVLDLVSPKGTSWPKRLILNLSNAMQLSAAFGDETDDWAGNVIEIWTEMVTYNNESVPGIKVLPAANGQQPVPTASAPPAQLPRGKSFVGPSSDLDDEIPF